jgi:hypothetical protein
MVTEEQSLGNEIVITVITISRYLKSTSSITLCAWGAIDINVKHNNRK